MSRCISLTLTAAFLAATFMASPAEARRPRTCDAAVAPAIVDFTPDSTSFFYVTVELTNRAQITLGFEYDGDQWSFAEQYGTPGICQGQLDTFTGYTLSILTSASCAAPTVYTPAEEAIIAGYIQEVENFCQDNLPPPPPPPPPACDAAVAPTITDFVVDSGSFFYVTVALTDGSSVILGFEYDGDQWYFAEQYGTAGNCQGQLDTFVNYTVSILTSQYCGAPTVYTPAEEAVIAWYVQEAENFCQDNLPPSCSPVQTLALTPADASSVPLTPNGCGTTSWCALNQISAWTIPLCLAQPATVSDVTELVLMETREESSLPWGTFMDRAGLTSTRFLVGTDGATLFSSLDALAGSTTVEGWYFAVPVACHNCTEFDVTTVLYYPETGFVMSLDGLYGWDS